MTTSAKPIPLPLTYLEVKQGEPSRPSCMNAVTTPS